MQTTNRIANMSGINGPTDWLTYALHVINSMHYMLSAPKLFIKWFVSSQRQFSERNELDLFVWLRYGS
jgi:hypothetical protein